MSIDLNSISTVLNRARMELNKGKGSPVYYNHEQKRAWREGFDYCIESFVQTALHVTRELVRDQDIRDSQEAVADPFYDRIDHLLWKAREHRITPEERAELTEDHKRLRALEKAGRRPKVDPRQHVVVFHGEPTGKLNLIPREEPEVNRETEQ